MTSVKNNVFDKNYRTQTISRIIAFSILSRAKFEKLSCNIVALNQVFTRLIAVKLFSQPAKLTMTTLSHLKTLRVK